MGAVDDRVARAPAEGVHDGNYRELLALIRGLDNRVTETRDDAREARDASRALAERLGAQDIPTKLAEVRAEVDAGFKDARSDLVNAMSKTTTEMRVGFDSHDERFEKLEARTMALENFKTRIEGAGGLFSWLSKNAPWLVAMLFAAAAFVSSGLQERIK